MHCKLKLGSTLNNYANSCHKEKGKKGEMEYLRIIMKLS